MRRGARLFLLAAAALAVCVAAGCTKRYYPTIHEEIIDEGVPISQRTVVE